MVTALSDQLFRPISDFSSQFRRPITPKIHPSPAPRFIVSRNGNPAGKNCCSFKALTRKSGSNSRWFLGLSPVEQTQQISSFDINEYVDFLYKDLPHLFDEQGIDRKMYDEHVKFRDPITKHDNINGYLFNIALLKLLFRPDFQLHIVKQTGAYELTTRWTMVMKFGLLPWKPELVFTGTTIMGISPTTHKFCSHVASGNCKYEARDKSYYMVEGQFESYQDFWDSINKNDYFSLEGLWDVLKQLRIYKTPDLESPKYQILKRTANYEVRKYAPFVVVETKGDKLSGSAGFNDVAGYIFGKNSSLEKIPMTTPVFTEALDDELSTISIQIVLPLKKELDNLPDPSQESVSLRKVEEGIAAVSKFSGKPTEDIVREKETRLRSALLRDNLKPRERCMLARYNDPGRTWSFLMRNEVLIWLEEFSLD